MKYMLFLDVQKSNIKDSAARTIAKRIIDCAYQLKDREDVFTFASSLEPDGADAGGDESELFSCLGSLVNVRSNRHGLLSTFPSLTRMMAEKGRLPEEIYVCGFEASGIVLFASLLFKAIHPTAKVTIIDDLSFDMNYSEKLAALTVAERLGVGYATAKVALGITFHSELPKEAESSQSSAPSGEQDKA